MELAQFVCDFERAVLEGNEDQIRYLFEESRWRSMNHETLENEVWRVALHLCQGNYVEVFNHQTARIILGTDDDVTTDKDYDVLVKESVSSFINCQSSDHELRLRQLLVMLVGVSCLQLFIQQNWTGPPVNLNLTAILPSALRNETELKNLQDHAIAKLCIDGESIYSLTEVPLYLLLSRTILVECSAVFSLCHSCSLWTVRCLSVHQQLLAQHSDTIKTDIFQNVEKLQSSTSLLSEEKNRNIACELHLELGYLSLYYYEFVKAKEHFAAAEKCTDLKICLSGALGKRTRFQEKDTSQLVVEVTRVEGHIETDWTNDKFACDPEHLPKDVALNDDTLLDCIKFKDAHLQTVPVSLGPIQQAVLIARCIQSQKLQAVERLTEEEMLAYIEGVLSRCNAWAVQYLALFIRSRLEKGSSRRMERSMMQFEALVDASKLELPKVCFRQTFFHCLRLPPRWDVQKELARLLSKMGAVKSAMEIYLRLHMWEDVIGCYHLLGWHGKAENLIREQLNVKETADMWCLLGDTIKDPSCYHKAWEVSSHRSSRAQRSLGLLHIRQRKYAESIPCFQKSLEISSLQEGVWFSLGCAAMATEQMDLAVKAFHRCIYLNADNAEAWNNLASVYIKTNQKKRAHRALQEALKASYENWHMWENFLLVSTDVGAFDDVITAYHRLLDLKEKYTEVEVLGILVRAANENIPDMNGNPGSRIRGKLLKLLGRITAQVTNNAEVWRLYSDLYMAGGQDGDKEKALQFLVKSYRVQTQASGWEKDTTQFQEMIGKALHLMQVYMEVSKSKSHKQEAIQLLSSAKLNMKQLISTAKKQHTDAISGQVCAELAEPVRNLETELENITQEIAQLKT